MCALCCVASSRFQITCQQVLLCLKNKTKQKPFWCFFPPLTECLLELCLQHSIFPFHYFWILKNNLFRNIFIGTFYKLLLRFLSPLPHHLWLLGVYFTVLPLSYHEEQEFLIFCLDISITLQYLFQSTRPLGFLWLLSLFSLYLKSVSFLFVSLTHHFKNWALLFFLSSQVVAVLYFLSILW